MYGPCKNCGGYALNDYPESGLCDKCVRQVELDKWGIKISQAGSKSFLFVLPIVPKGQMRSRSRAEMSKSGKSYAMTYKAPEQKNREDGLKALLREKIASSENASELPTTCPVRISIVAEMPKGASWSKKRKADPGHHTSRPDVDNLAKQVLDCCNGMLWVDDSQVFSLLISKRYSNTPKYVIEMLIFNQDQ